MAAISSAGFVTQAWGIVGAKFWKVECFSVLYGDIVVGP